MIMRSYVGRRARQTLRNYRSPSGIFDHGMAKFIDNVLADVSSPVLLDSGDGIAAALK